MSVPADRDAAFVAKVTASATHEIRNVLAIIKESAGLIGDVLHSSGGRALQNADKLVRAVGRIDAQVSRGAELISSLNRFAHSQDRAGDPIDLNQEVQQVASLCQRIARLGRHRLQVQPAEGALPTRANPLWLQMALFAAVERCFGELPEGGTLTIRTGRQGNRPSIEFAAEAGEGANSPPAALYVVRSSRTVEPDFLERAPALVRGEAALRRFSFLRRSNVKRLISSRRARIAF